MNSADKEKIIQILSDSFRENKSTNFVIKQDAKTDKRLKKLIEYSVFNGEQFGEVVLTEDQTACAILLDTGKKKTTLKSIAWDMRLILNCIGISRVRKVLKREALIKSHHPKNNFIHLWYLGVKPTEQGRGKGTELLKKIIEQARLEKKAIYLETSTVRNFKFYKALGFEETATLDQLGYSIKMFALK